mmetsp:Transcript_9233/g.34148  ORF Transcript_9233/g.34148 Transcript_9233/m.34148 type:complete len:121 (+) Transcript_9233:545-907(+)
MRAKFEERCEGTSIHFASLQLSSAHSLHGGVSPVKREYPSRPRFVIQYVTKRNAAWNTAGFRTIHDMVYMRSAKISQGDSSLAQDASKIGTLPRVVDDLPLSNTYLPQRGEFEQLHSTDP